MGFTVQTAMSLLADGGGLGVAFLAGRLYPSSGLATGGKDPGGGLERAHEKIAFLPDMLANGERVKGIVTRITDKGVDIRLGKYSGSSTTRS